MASVVCGAFFAVYCNLVGCTVSFPLSPCVALSSDRAPIRFAAMSHLPAEELKSLQDKESRLDVEVAQEKKKVEDATAKVEELEAQWLKAELNKEAKLKAALEGAKQQLEDAKKMRDDAMDRRKQVLARIERLQSGALTPPVALLSPSLPILSPLPFSFCTLFHLSTLPPLLFVSPDVCLTCVLMVCYGVLRVPVAASPRSSTGFWVGVLLWTTR